MLHRPEVGSIDVDLTEFLARLRFGQPDRADCRLAEDRRRDIAIIHAPVLTGIGIVREDHTFRDGDGGQGDAVDHITQRIDRRHVGLKIVIDLNRAFRRQLDADLFQTKVFGLGLPADRHQDRIGFHHRAIVQRRRERPVRVFVDPADDGVHAKVDPFLADFTGQKFPNIVIEPTQEHRPAIELRDLRAKPVQHTGKLNGDITAPANDDAFWQIIHEEELIG